MNKFVTVIIPVRNGGQTIKRAIDSAYNSGCDRVMIYDDASTDNTVDILEKASKEYPNLEIYADLYMNMRRGVNYGRNYLCQYAPDGLILPLDADDTLNDIALLRDAWSEGTWCYGDYNECDDYHVRQIKGCPAGSLSRKEITGVSFIFSKSDWKNVGGYDPDFAFCEDWGFQCCLTSSGIKPQYVDTIVYNRYLKPQGNQRTTLAGEYWQHYRDMARRKYPALFAVNR